MCRGEIMEQTTILTKNGNSIPIQVFETDRIRIHQWQVRYVDLGEGNEQYRECGKIRPCLIISSDIYNSLPDAAIIIIPMSKSPMYNCVVDDLIGLRLPMDPSTISILCMNQIQSIHRDQLQNVVCENIPDQLKDIILKSLVKRFAIPTPAEIDVVATEEVIGQDNEVQQQNNIIEHCIENQIVINPAYMNMLSILQCSQIIEKFEIGGVEAFKETKNYNEKTVMAAIKRCRSRVKNIA